MSTILDLMWPIDFWNNEWVLGEWPYLVITDSPLGCTTRLSTNLVGSIEENTDILGQTALLGDLTSTDSLATELKSISGLDLNFAQTLCDLCNLQYTSLFSTDIPTVLPLSTDLINITYEAILGETELETITNVSTDLITSTLLNTTLIANMSFEIDLCGCEDCNGN